MLRSKGSAETAGGKGQSPKKPEICTDIQPANENGAAVLGEGGGEPKGFLRL